MLYRTQFGIKLIEKIAKKKKLLNFLEKVVIVSGYVLMVIGMFMIYLIVKIMVLTPQRYIDVIKAPPIFPLIPYFTEIFKIDILPPFYFTYWIIIIAIASISHEFFHGIFFKKEGVKIKATGFAFLGPFLAAFVEPDEKSIEKVKKHKQLAALAAGTFANFLVAVIFSIIALLFIGLTFTPAGATFNVYMFSPINSSSISMITNNTISLDGTNITEIKINNTSYFLDDSSLKQVEKNNASIVYAFEDTPALRNKLKGAIVEFNNITIKNNNQLSEILLTYHPGDNATIKTSFNKTIEEYNITLIARPDNKTRAYLGVATYKMGFIGRILNKILFLEDYKPKFAPDLIIFIRDLFYWLILINLGMAFFNMVPSSVFDGGRFFYVSVLSLTKSKKIAEYAYKFMSYLIIGVFLLITSIWIFNFFK
jgi:membrane-associated protease RseP (regulator of RpoE activity)